MSSTSFTFYKPPNLVYTYKTVVPGVDKRQVFFCSCQSSVQTGSSCYSSQRQISSAREPQRLRPQYRIVSFNKPIISLNLSCWINVNRHQVVRISEEEPWRMSSATAWKLWESETIFCSITTSLRSAEAPSKARHCCDPRRRGHSSRAGSHVDFSGQHKTGVNKISKTVILTTAGPKTLQKESFLSIYTVGQSLESGPPEGRIWLNGNFCFTHTLISNCTSSQALACYQSWENHYGLRISFTVYMHKVHNGFLHISKCLDWAKLIQMSQGNRTNRGSVCCAAQAIWRAANSQHY